MSVTEVLHAGRTATGIAVACLGAVLVSGCATLQEVVDAPRIEITELSVVDADLSRQTFRLGLSLANDNPFPLPIARIDYALDLEGQRFVQGSSAQALTIGAGAVERVDLAFETDLVATAAKLVPLFIAGRSETLDYRLSGGVAVDIPLASDLLRFDQSGKVDLLRD
ncbi:MAG: LEA type 2 family protein [Pseudomonadota bacterium]